MSVKASKSKSLVIDRGEIVHDKSLCIVLGANCQGIPSIADNPVKFLGTTISGALSDKYQAGSLSLALTKGLSLISNSGHPAVQKLWILQHLLVPRLRWLLLIYQIPISVVTKLEQKISCCLRKWLHLHNTTTNISPYSSSLPCPLPLKSLSSIMKSAKVSGQVLLRESADPYLSEANVLLKSGNWSASEAVEEAKKILNFKQILVYHQCHRAGFGLISNPEASPKHAYAYRKLLTSMVEEAQEGKYQAKAVQLSVQGQWTKWCSCVRMDLSWKTLLAMPQQLLTFCLDAMYNTLPSPSNLHHWHISPEASCLLCKKTSFHYCSCSWSLYCGPVKGSLYISS